MEEVEKDLSSKSNESSGTDKETSLINDSEDEISLAPLENLVNKNTKSFQCFAQIEISRSSLLRDPLYHFPELEDPHLEEALWRIDDKPAYDDIGCERYRDLCKKEGIIPFRRVIDALPTEVLDLKFYALSEKAMRTICETLKYNFYVKHLILQENWLKPESVAHIPLIIENNTTIQVLDMKQCQIGRLGAAKLGDCLIYNKTLVELDLSHNNLGDEGIECLAQSLKENTSIRKLNLSHNNLGDNALIALRPVLEDNYRILDLDLSWNNFFSPFGMQALMEGLAENISIISLNLAWNGIGKKDTFRYIMLYLKSDSTHLQHLDLSYNRITGTLVKQLKTGLKLNESLVTLNLAFNPITADEVEYISNIFLEPRETPLTLTSIDFGNTWVKQSFIRMLNKIQKKGCSIAYGGIYSNYKIKGPNVKEILLKRAKIVAMKPKKKKLKKDVGHFIIELKDDPIPKDEFTGLIKKQKIKLDEDLIEMMLKSWEDPKKRVDVKNMKDIYLDLFPDTQPPPKKKQKSKGKGKKKKKV